MKSATIRKYGVGSAAILATFVVFVVPFIFIALTALKSASEAADLTFTLPTRIYFWENLLKWCRPATTC